MGHILQALERPPEPPASTGSSVRTPAETPGGTGFERINPHRNPHHKTPARTGYRGNGGIVSDLLRGQLGKITGDGNI